MQPVYLFDLASRQAEWLSVRQSAIAENVANANTPAYRSKDVEPFAATLEKTQLAMTASRPGHIGFGSDPVSAIETRNSVAGETHSGNTVRLENELMKSGEVSRDYSLNVSVVKAFHRMWMAGLKG